MNRFEKAMKATERAYNFLIEKGYDVLAVALYGSQNYGIDTPESDFDFKALTFPSLEDVILNKKRISKTVEFEGGQIDVKDAALMFGCYKKMNVNFVETLFTKWYKVNPNFSDEWEQVRQLAPTLVYADRVKAMACMVGMAYEKRHALCHPYEGKLAILEKYGYDGKQVSHELRLLQMLKKYIQGLQYENILTPSSEEALPLINLKTWNPVLSLDEVTEMADSIITEMEGLRETALKQNNYTVDEECFQRLDSLLVEMMMKNFRRKLAE